MNLLVIILIYIPLIKSDNCKTWETCSDCMSYSEECQWCSDIDFEGANRCMSVFSMESKCTGLMNLQNEEKLIKNQPLDSSNLVKPQEVKLKIRPGLKHDLTFTIRKSVDYPVDFYFLFDLSFSMNKTRYDWYARMSPVTIFGHIHFRQNFRKKFYMKIFFDTY